MARGGVAKLFKCLLFTATFLICLGGITIFAVGIWATLQKVAAVEQLLGSEMYTVASYVFVATGAAIAFVSALGCCGAIKENKFKLALYFIILFVIFIILFAGGIMGWLFKDKVEDTLFQGMEKSVKEYGKKDYATNSWNAIQIFFKCCGFVYNTTNKESYQVWEGNEYLEKENMTVPGSCCKDIQEQVACQMDPKNKVFQDDCYVVVKEYFKKNAKIVGAIGIGIALFLIIGMILTCCVYRSLT